MAVEITPGLIVNQANDVTMLDKLYGVLGVILFVQNILRGRLACFLDNPLVVGIAMVIARDLLLLRARWVGLHMRMKQSAVVAIVFKRELGTVRQLHRTIKEFVSLKVGLE